MSDSDLSHSDVSSGAPGPRRLHPISMADKAIKSAPGVLIGMVGAFSVLAQRNPGLAILIALSMVAMTVLGAAIGWWRFTYEVRDREIVIARGLFSRQRRVIPFDRVRDVAIEQPLLARLAGTARVRIETGGAKADEGVLDMIEMAEARNLRERIRHSNVMGAAVEVVAEAAGQPGETMIFAMSIGRVLGSGLLNFSLIFIALAFGALQYLDDLRIIDIERIAEAGGVRGVASLVTPRSALIVFVLLVALGVVSGVVRTVLRDFNFTLTSGPAGLRRRRGLITLSEVLIPSRRTEAARIDTGWLSGWLGWHALAFQTLGAAARDGGVQTAAPFARAEEMAFILEEAGFPPRPTGAMIRPPARALIRRCGPWLLFAVAAGVAGTFWSYAWWGVAAAALGAVAALLGWLRDGHRLGETALYVREGVVRRRLWIIPYEKMQTLSTRRGPLQRPLGLASVAPDTAGATPFGAPLIADLERQEAETLADRLLADFYTARARVRASVT